jgi:LCP family protein required for cell wall assembly
MFPKYAPKVTPLITFNRVVGYELKQSMDSKPKKTVLANIKRYLIKLIIVFSVVLMFLIGAAVLFIDTQVNSYNETTLSPYSKEENVLDLAKNIITQNPTPLNGQSQGRTNFLVIGEDYSGLTDTIQLMSYYWSTDEVNYINIPRDLEVVYQGKKGKINEVYARSIAAEPEKAPEQALADFVSAELNLPIHHWVKIRIDDLRILVDKLGGVEVDVKNSFTDCLYPNKDYTDYIRPCPSFTKGVQTLDGNRALVYARSRKSDNPREANDFARSRRQSQVITSLMEKLRSYLTFQDIQNINQLDSVFKSIFSMIRTDISLSQVYSLYQEQKDSGSIVPKGYYLSYGKNNILCDDLDSSLIQYCDGAVAGDEESSKSRDKLREVVLNLNEYARD